VQYAWLFMRYMYYMMYASVTSRRPRYEVGYEDDSPNDVVGYHQCPNLDLLIFQSAYQPLSFNDSIDLPHEQAPESIYQRYEPLRDYP